MDKEFIIKVVKYVADNHTISETAKYFNKSESSIKKYLALFRDINSIYYDEKLFEKLKLRLDEYIFENEGNKWKR